MLFPSLDCKRNRPDRPVANAVIARSQRRRFSPQLAIGSRQLVRGGPVENEIGAWCDRGCQFCGQLGSLRGFVKLVPRAGLEECVECLLPVLDLDGGVNRWVVQQPLDRLSEQHGLQRDAGVGLHGGLDCCQFPVVVGIGVDAVGDEHDDPAGASFLKFSQCDPQCCQRRRGSIGAEVVNVLERFGEMGVGQRAETAQDLDVLPGILGDVRLECRAFCLEVIHVQVDRVAGLPDTVAKRDQTDVRLDRVAGFGQSLDDFSQPLSGRVPSLVGVITVCQAIAHAQRAVENEHDGLSLTLAGDRDNPGFLVQRNMGDAEDGWWARVDGNRQ